MVTFTLLTGPASAFCRPLGRSMTDQELIESVVAKKAVGDFEVYFSNGPDGPPMIVDRVDTVAEFLSAYPECCEVYRSGMAGYSSAPNLWRWITREVWPVVGVTYPKVLYGEDLSIREEMAREYFEVDSCGNLVRDE